MAHPDDIDETFSRRGRRAVIMDFLKGKTNRDGFLYLCERWHIDNLTAMQVFQIKYEGRKITPQEMYEFIK